MKGSNSNHCEIPMTESVGLNSMNERHSALTAASFNDNQNLIDAKSGSHYPMVDTKLLDERGNPLENAFEGNPVFSSLSVRINFIRKVYAILSLQILFTTFISILGCTLAPFKHFLGTNTGLIVALVMMLILFFMSFVIYFGHGYFLRRAPFNYIFLIIFTCLMSFVMAGLCASTNYKLVLLALILTLVVTMSITVYACLSTSDISIERGIVVQILSVLAFGLSIYFIGGSFGIKILHMILIICGAIFYGVFLLFDSMMLFSDERWGFKIDDYILAALSLYIDIILIFIKILECVTTIFKTNDSI